MYAVIPKALCLQNLRLTLQTPISAVTVALAVRQNSNGLLTREKRSFCRPSLSTGGRERSLIAGIKLSSMSGLY